MPETVSISNPKAVSKPKKAAKKLFVVKVRCIPFGFFEKELLGYFSQFGTVVRVRVARSLKTGNFKGWAYVGFDNKDVAEIACETMNGYLMFEKRLICTVMTDNPKCMLYGPQLRAPPHMKGAAKKDTKQRHAVQSAEKVDKVKERMVKQLAKQEQELKNMGIDYDFSAVPSYTKASSAASAMDVKKKEEKSIDEVMELGEVTPKKPAKRISDVIANSSKREGSVKKAKRTSDVIANIVQKEGSAKKAKRTSDVIANSTPKEGSAKKAKRTSDVIANIVQKEGSAKKSMMESPKTPSTKKAVAKTPRKTPGPKTPSVPTRIQPKRNKSVHAI